MTKNPGISSLPILPFSLLLLCLFSFSVRDFGQRTSYCGTYATQPASSTSPNSLFFDRFGNSYDVADLLVAPVQASVSNRSAVNYFNPVYLGNPPDDVKKVVEQVFEDVSQIILQRPGAACSSLPPGTVNVQVVWLDFSNPNQNIVNQLHLMLPLNPDALGVSTPFFSYPMDGGCSELVLHRPFIKLNGGVINDIPGSPTFFDCRILINSSFPTPVNDPDGCTSYSWNTNSTASSFPCKYDLYSVMLHETMHVLGFASLIGFNDFFSLWDHHLYLVDNYVPNSGSTNTTPVLTNTSVGCTQNCWQFNNGFPAVAVHSCEDNSTGPDVVFGQNGIAPVAGLANANPNVAGELQNFLSHLSPKCSGQFVDYVMTPRIGPNVARRNLTDPEIQILCELGYWVNTSTEPCDGCYIIANEDSPDDFYSCCDRYFSLCREEVLHISQNDLLCNDLSNGGIEITRIWPAGNSSDNNPVITPSGDGWDFIFGPNATDTRVTIFYTIKNTGCGNCLMHNGHFSLYLDECVPCENPADTCDNLLCVYDFEAYTPKSVVYFGHPFIFDGYPGPGTPDVLEESNGNNFLFLADYYSNREGVALKLKTCIPPGCTLQLDFEASQNHDAIPDLPDEILNIWGSKFLPCSATMNPATPIANTCGTPTNCGGGQDPYNPVCIGAVTISNLTSDFYDPFLIQANLQAYPPVIWTNLTNEEVCYLTLAPSTSDWSGICLDKLRARVSGENCPCDREDPCLEVHVGEIRCFDNSTANPDDDYWNFDIFVSQGPGTFWRSGPPLYEAGPYNQWKTMWVGSIATSANPFILTIYDNEHPECSTDISVPVPEPCSDSCNLAISANIGECNNHGTPTLVSDDYYSVSVTVSGTNGACWMAKQKKADGTEVILGTFHDDGTFPLGQFKIQDGDWTLWVFICDQMDCVEDLFIEAPAFCSGCQEVAVSNITCYNNGTGNSADDTWTFDLYVNGGPGSSWTATPPVGQSGSYGQVKTIQMGQISHYTNQIQFTIYDNLHPECRTELIVPVPHYCSDSCVMQMNLRVGDCVYEEGHAVYYVNLEVSGSNGACWMAKQKYLNGTEHILGTYYGDQTVTLGPFDPALGDWTIWVPKCEGIVCILDEYISAPECVGRPEKQASGGILALSTEFRLYPSPVSEVLVVQELGKAVIRQRPDVLFQVYDILGRPVYETKLAAAAEYRLPVGALGAGVYFLAVREQGRVRLAGKFVKE